MSQVQTAARAAATPQIMRASPRAESGADPLSASAVSDPLRSASGGTLHRAAKSAAPKNGKKAKKGV